MCVKKYQFPRGYSGISRIGVLTLFFGLKFGQSLLVWVSNIGKGQKIGNTYFTSKTYLVPGPFVILGRRRKGLGDEVGFRLRPHMTKGPGDEVGAKLKIPKIKILKYPDS